MMVLFCINSDAFEQSNFDFGFNLKLDGKNLNICSNVNLMVPAAKKIIKPGSSHQPPQKRSGCRKGCKRWAWFEFWIWVLDCGKGMDIFVARPLAARRMRDRAMAGLIGTKLQRMGTGACGKFVCDLIY